MAANTEFEYIMNREKLFATGEAGIPTEGKMYDVIDGVKGDMLGAMTGWVMNVWYKGALGILKLLSK